MHGGEGVLVVRIGGERLEDVAVRAAGVGDQFAAIARGDHGFLKIDRALVGDGGVAGAVRDEGGWEVGSDVEEGRECGGFVFELGVAVARR